MTSPAASPSPVGRRLRAAVLGATGSVGQRFVQLLDRHPWFELIELAASERSAGRPYGEVVDWVLPGAAPPAAADLRVGEVDGPLEAEVVFSALDASLAGPLEERRAREGRLVVSNASSHRMDRDVPLLVPEVNADHLELLARQDLGRGALVANPNCTTAGLVLALAPLARAFGLRRVFVTTLQAVSGAGLAGPRALDLVDNLLPHIPGEEEKVERETRRILGHLTDAGVEPADVGLSAHCTRVPVLDGHTLCASVELGRRAPPADLRAAWETFRGPPQELALPSAPTHPVVVLEDPDAPQPRRHRDLERGMATLVGRLRPCPLLDARFTLLSHNTIRGAAGGALLAAELVIAQGAWRPN